MNYQKAIEVVLWIIQNGETNMYNIWKILFAAEKYHINKYGRPITGDQYMAMQYGTVPSWLYGAANIKRQGIGFYRDENSLIAERPATLDYLSETDIVALKFGMKEYAGLSFDKVMAKNHQEKAWKDNWEKRGNSDRHPIPFEDIIDEEWLREDLSVLSHSMVL